MNVCCRCRPPPNPHPDASAPPSLAAQYDSLEAALAATLDIYLGLLLQVGAARGPQGHVLPPVVAVPFPAFTTHPDARSLTSAQLTDERGLEVWVHPVPPVLDVTRALVAEFQAGLEQRVRGAQAHPRAHARLHLLDFWGSLLGPVLGHFSAAIKCF